MKVIRQEKDIHESVMDEYARYLAMKNQADLAYIAMMNGIELEEETNERNEQSIWADQRLVYTWLLVREKSKGCSEDGEDYQGRMWYNPFHQRLKL